MKIAISCHTTQGGSGIVATELATALVRRGHEVHLVACSRPFRLREDSGVHFHQCNVPDYPLFRFPPHDLALANKLSMVVKNYGVEAIHAHYAVPHAVTALLAKHVVAPQRVKVVTTLHGTDITLVGSHKDFYDLIRYAMRASDGLTAVSAWLRDETARRFCLDKPPEVIPNFVDTTRFNPVGRAPYPGPDEVFHLVHASNLRAVKRIPDTIRVFHLVRQKLNARLTILGEGPDRGVAETLVQDLGLADSVVFNGISNEMPAILRTAHLYLLFSEYESFGLSALEALACGVPAAVSASGGLPEVVKNGETGILCPVGDVYCVAGSIVNLLSDPDAWHAMSKSAAADARSRFDAEKIVPLYEDLYRRIIEEK
jgi:N-acetyl-alpha-D-glucosaminyl L-malate synthase BshA